MSALKSTTTVSPWMISDISMILWSHVYIIHPIVKFWSYLGIVYTYQRLLYYMNRSKRHVHNYTSRCNRQLCYEWNIYIYYAIVSGLSELWDSTLLKEMCSITHGVLLLKCSPNRKSSHVVHWGLLRMNSVYKTTCIHILKSKTICTVLKCIQFALLQNLFCVTLHFKKQHTVC